MPPSKTHTRVLRPAGTAGQRLALESELRPDNVPASATLLVSYIDLPNENAQRRGHWAVHAVWKQQLLRDFAECMNAQPHPGMIPDPRVYIQLHVMGVGDDVNRRSRAKYVIDVLQEHAADKNGNRHRGFLNLFKDDKMLRDSTLTIEEIRAKRNKTGEITPRSGKQVVEAGCKVLVWVWGEEEAPF